MARESIHQGQETNRSDRVPTYIPQELGIQIQSLLDTSNPISDPKSIPKNQRSVSSTSTVQVHSPPIASQKQRQEDQDEEMRDRDREDAIADDDADADADAGEAADSNQHFNEISNVSLTEHLASLFPTPSSLDSQNLEKAHALTRERIERSRNQVHSLVREISDEEKDGRMERVDTGMKTLEEQLSWIKEKSAASEEVVRDITRDIRTLDTAKRNVVGSVTALRRLGMLVNAADNLTRLSSTQRYRDAAQALQAVKALQLFFKSYLAVERVAQVWKTVGELQATLRGKVMGDYEAYFLNDTASRPLRSTSLPDAALLIDALGPEARNALLDWYCALQLREYRRIFRATDEAGGLDNVSRRFAWFRRVLRTHEEEHRAAFLDEWNVSRALVERFTKITREDVKSVLVRERGSLRVEPLLEALNSTMDFEKALAKKFGTPFSELVSPQTAPPTPGSSSHPQASSNSFTLSSVFQPYLSIYVESQDNRLSEMMNSYRRQGSSLPRTSNSLDGQPDPSNVNSNAAQDAHHTVLPSSTELFYFYRQTLEQCATLDRGETFEQLTKVYAKWLVRYREDVLKAGLVRSEPLPRRSLDSRPSLADIQRWCLILNTADYCATTASQLEDKLKEKISPQLKENVSLEGEREGFRGIISAAVSCLVRELETSLEGPFTQMMRPQVPWSQFQLPPETTPSSKSSYADELETTLEQVAAVVRQDTENKRYVRSFSDKAVGIILARFTHNTVKLKPLSSSTAEQLLFDVTQIRTHLLELPRYSSEESNASIAASYARYVNKGVSRLETLLKVVRLPDSPPDVLPQGYVDLVSDRSFSNFQKILDLKGVRPVEQNAIVDKFLSITSGRDDLSDTSFLTTLDMDPSSQPHQQANYAASDGMSTPPHFSRSNPSTAPWSSSLGIPDGMRSPPTEGGYSYYNQQGQNSASGGGGGGGGGGAGRAFSDLKRFGSLFGKGFRQ